MFYSVGLEELQYVAGKVWLVFLLSPFHSLSSFILSTNFLVYKRTVLIFIIYLFHMQVFVQLLLICKWTTFYIYCNHLLVYILASSEAFHCLKMNKRW